KLLAPSIRLSYIVARGARVELAHTSTRPTEPKKKPEAPLLNEHTNSSHKRNFSRRLHYD
ncbi:MAG: hypothetical protein OXG36_14980, partial [Caldilineaceae bacterium]|nr:hypothetical protein [Caldilineaceae bacterium]